MGEEVSVRKDFVLRPFATCHTVRSQGYLVIRKKKKLKQEFVGVGPQAIIAAKKQGIEINDFAEVSSARLCFLAILCLFGVAQLAITVVRASCVAEFNMHSVIHTPDPESYCTMYGKQRGDNWSEMVQVPEVAFTGDTTIDFVKDPANHAALNAKLLIMECTFMDDAVDQDGAKARGHMHVRDLAEYADSFQVYPLQSVAET